MDKNGTSIVFKLNPAVPRQYHFVVAGGLWTMAGAMLCLRAIHWLDLFPLIMKLALGAIGIAVAAAAHMLLFSKVVRRNIERIWRLPDRACVFAFTAWKGYLMIALMVSIGIFVRSSTKHVYYLSVPYIAMGTVLFIGSAGFYREFLAAAMKDRSQSRNRLKKRGENAQVGD